MQEHSEDKRFNHCQAQELEKLILSTQDGEVCTLTKECYYIERRINIRNKNGIRINGNNATIYTHYVNNSNYTESADALYFENCNSITISDLSFDTDCPINVSATVSSISRDDGCYTAHVDDDTKMNGDEIFMAQNTIDKDQSPDCDMDFYALHPDKNIITVMAGEIYMANTYYDAKKEYLGNNNFKIFPPDKFFERLSVGRRLCIRHTVYGPVLMLFKGCSDVIVKNVRVYAAPGMGIVVLPRCKNFTIDGFRVERNSESHCYMACNCDGIHITGLSGKLIMKNCYFDGLGDDALNVHSIAATITSFDESSKEINCNYCKKSPNGKLSNVWCMPGDKIRVFNPDDCSAKAEFIVTYFNGEKMNYDDFSGKLNNGFIMQNLSLAPQVEIDNCTVRNTRARGFLLQTDNVEIKNCKLYGTCDSAIKAAPSMKYWYEVGPTDGLKIHDNRFVKCCCTNYGAYTPVVAVHTTHNSVPSEMYHVHKNINVSNNIFENVSGICISVASSDSVEISGNTYKNYTKKDDLERIRTVYCNNLKISDEN